MTRTLFQTDRRGSEASRYSPIERLPRRAGLVLAAAIAAMALLLAAACGSGGDETATDFTLPSAFGTDVSLSRVLSEHDVAVLVFYRGSF